MGIMEIYCERRERTGCLNCLFGTMGGRERGLGEREGEEERGEVERSTVEVINRMFVLRYPLCMYNLYGKEISLCLWKEYNVSVALSSSTFTFSFFVTKKKNCSFRRGEEGWSAWRLHIRLNQFIRFGMVI